MGRFLSQKSLLAVERPRDDLRQVLQRQIPQKCNSFQSKKSSLWAGAGPELNKWFHDHIAVVSDAEFGAMRRNTVSELVYVSP